MPDFAPYRPFTRAEGIAGSLTAWQLRGRDIVRLHRNVYVARRAPRTLGLRGTAVLKVAPPRTVMSHHTAALLWGGSVPPTSDLYVRIPWDETFRVRGVRTHE